MSGFWSPCNSRSQVDKEHMAEAWNGIRVPPPNPPPVVASPIPSIIRNSVITD